MTASRKAGVLDRPPFLDTSRRSKTRKLLKTPKDSYRRLEMDSPNVQWQSDVWHGPYLPHRKDSSKNQRTFLIAFMDDFSRLAHGSFYPAEAILKRGLPARLYCDNGAIYNSKQFSRIAAELGINHISGRPYAPSGFWRSVNSSFLPELWLESRHVDKTSQFSLQGNRYEVDSGLARRKLQIRYNPFDLSVIQVWCVGQRFEDARPYDLFRQHDRRVRPRAQEEVTLPRTGLSYLDLLIRKHRSQAREDLGKTVLGELLYGSTSPMALCLVGLRLRAFEAIRQRVTLRFYLTGVAEP